MNFFQRLANFISGLFSTGMGNIEKSNPEIVYENAINERKKKQKELTAAVANIIAMRDKTKLELEKKEKELAEAEEMLEVAMDEGDDEAAIHILEGKSALESRVSELQAELERVASQAEDAMDTLSSFRSEIIKLTKERDEMLAKNEAANARIKIQESLDGFSVDADMQALENVRSSINQKVAQADVEKELGDKSLDKKLDKIKAKTGESRARRQLEALKKKREAQQAQAADGGPSVKKTI